MKNLLFIGFVLFFMYSCQSEIEKHAQHYQKHKDIESLQKTIDLIDIGVDTSYVTKILGEPIDFGFDYRYLTNKVGENGCPIGAVFGINESGKITSKSIFEICE